ncbi:MAG: GNAT family N-acetyltransferase [Ilumatobacter sp.]|uniref:GNAT family N-acetyltransferase n=1 Tax=Ilumatobacter sp. TaxID=1967498 RepID=UPI00261D6DFE|nr:GNAT family N-acetyltransferase [Ilumatobacter sp.]MDJ0769002.1 GNAT family N-acetyltransferase [Ilumatobacter sp.]
MIRPFTDADLEAVLGVWHRASLVAHSFLPDEFFDRERQEIADLWLPAAETTVATTDDDHVAGFVSMLGNEVGAIFVDPDRQREGVGRALLDAVSASRPCLVLDVFEANAIGRRFYEAYGFEVVDRHLNDEIGHWELRLRFER